MKRTDFNAERKAKANAKFDAAIFNTERANFNASWKNAIKSIDKDTNKIVKESIEMLFNDIVKDTPVKSGLLRGNWFASLNAPDTDVVVTKDISGSKARSNIAMSLRNFTLKDAAFLCNNVEYAKDIEYGSSKKAPFGMVRINVARFDRIIQHVASRFKK